MPATGSRYTPLAVYCATLW